MVFTLSDDEACRQPESSLVNFPKNLPHVFPHPIGKNSAHSAPCAMPGHRAPLCYSYDKRSASDRGSDLGKEAGRVVKRLLKNLGT